VRDAIGEDARLAGARAGDDEKRSLGGQDRVALSLVEVGEVALGGRDGDASMLPRVRYRDAERAIVTQSDRCSEPKPGPVALSVAVRSREWRS
jgi:hypothetical protein